MSTALTYAVITPVRNEEANLARLADCLAAQTIQAALWVIVDNGSTDHTGEIAAQLMDKHTWVRFESVPGEAVPTRGAPVVRAFTAGLGLVEPSLDVVVKLDADISFEADHFERLLAEFAEDPSLGLAGGTCWELEHETWRPQHTTRGHVRGAERAYRRACLAVVLPLEQRMGWDGIDELKAAVSGWRTASFAYLPLLHHRGLGARERRLGKWLAQGEMAYYMWYRPSYVTLRALYRGLKDPVAPAMVLGYVLAALRRGPRLPDPEVRAWLRREQGIRRLRLRVREALGRVQGGGSGSPA